jgi:uncharacterized repeat protein (TIGR03803 family)
VFRIGSDGSFTNLISFSSQVTGDTPYGGVIEGSDGYLYGTTRGFGSYGGNIYRIARDGSSFTNLHTLLGYFSGDGAHPKCNLLEAGDGYLYGTTGDDGAGGNGIVFRITPSGSIYTNLETLPGGSTAGLTIGGDGNLYGVTSANVFRVTSSNTALATYTFNTTPDGNSPIGALVKGADGNLYGTANSGGAHGNGTVFRITGGNSLLNLHSFGDSAGDGYSPLGTLVLGSDGNFYGTTPAGGAQGYGTIFRISPGGVLTNLYSFAFSTVDAYSPNAGLVQGSDGSFYGTTFSGGSNNFGTVFKFTVPLGSPANQIPAFGLNGTNAIITITTVAGSKYQLQSSTSLTSSWSNAGSPIVGIGGPQTVTNSGPVSPVGKFYRFQITP